MSMNKGYRNSYGVQPRSLIAITGCNDDTVKFESARRHSVSASLEVIPYTFFKLLSCPGEECTSLFSDPCTAGYRCTLDNPEERFDTGGKGHCRLRNETAAGHHEHGTHN
ncbi:hypothetical protein HPB50_003928 [Hyalomma asiaticum]|uniref:Uncharacterized protein n=1 Tax=Hyalomma asiaticum TaxID=266040 RepID=A0ACB7T7T6_HYAAI|nr:hypothetical protein HPB50_003928 [Hyalomma asiaticum]